MRSIGAGICIGLGGLCYLSVSDNTLGALLFSIGLLSVLIFQFHLYTGWVCYSFRYKRPISLLGVLIGNFLGAMIIGLMTRYNPELLDTIWNICGDKLDKSWPSWFVASIFCGAFIAIAVISWGFTRNFPSYFTVILSIMGFILTGSEHVVADMYYFSAGLILDNIEVWYRLLVCAIGNMIGGFIVGQLILDSWLQTAVESRIQQQLLDKLIKAAESNKVEEEN